MSYREYFKGLVDRRVEKVQKRADKFYRDWGKRLDKENPGDVEDRTFLEKHAIGIGVDIACGDLVIGDALGVDVREWVLGVDYNTKGDELTFSKSGEMDYVVTNYLEALPSTLNALNEWHRCLKPGGTLAMICRDANSYNHKRPAGALTSNRRCNTFNKITLSHYLHRAGYREIDIVETDHASLQVVARKPSVLENS
jgi:SAM-dependent methyltransferase